MDAVREQVHDSSDDHSRRPVFTFDMPQDSWRKVFAELAAGRRQALEDLYEGAGRNLYGLALWRTGSPEDAADVMQEVFVRVAEQRHRLAKVKDPKSWLLAVTHRAAVDVTRRRARRPERPLEECGFLAATGIDADRGLDARRASELLAQLPPAQRDAIFLHHFAGCTFAAIGDIVGVPTFTAASRYRLGVEKLRRLMEARP
jgi:RNA polymerase sigma-70 factor (ECF subfamily)